MPVCGRTDLISATAEWLACELCGGQAWSEPLSCCCFLHVKKRAALVTSPTQGAYTYRACANSDRLQVVLKRQVLRYARIPPWKPFEVQTFRTSSHFESKQL